jgi:hypothetical protein
MSIQRTDRGEPWFQFHPVEGRLTRSADAKTPLLVDIGGNLGADIAAFHSRFPALRGILILEDLPGVIDSIKELDTSIEQVKHDFFCSTTRHCEGRESLLF